MGRERLWTQVAAAVVMSQTHVIFAVWICFGGLLIAEAQSAEQAADGGSQLSPRDVTLVASISHVGRVLGCLLSAPLTDRLGVLRVIQLSTPLNLLAWPLMTLGSSREMMLVGGILAGSFVGLNASGGRLYIAEVTSTRTRGVLSYFPNMLIGLSLLVSFTLSAVAPWRYATLVCACAPSALHLLGAVLLPNSPRWLLNRGASDERARKAIAFYRGEAADVGLELKGIQESLRRPPNLSIPRQIRLLFTDWDVARPCLLLLVQFTLDTFCGGIVLTQYAPAIFRLAAGPLAPAQCTQLLAALQVASLAVSALLLRWCGRRTILSGAAALTCVGMLTAAAFYQFQASLSHHTWLLVAGVLLANAGSQAGISPLSHVFCGELLPLRVRQMFGNVISLHMGGVQMAFLHLFPALSAALGSAGLFLALAGVNLLQVVFARLMLPETSGLSLEEVQQRHFSRKKRVVAEAAPGQAEWKVEEANGEELKAVGGMGCVQDV